MHHDEEMLQALNSLTYADEVDSKPINYCASCGMPLKETPRTSFPFFNAKDGKRFMAKVCGNGECPTKQAREEK